jgi:hypothetical protein
MDEANARRRKHHEYHNKMAEFQPVTYAEARKWVKEDDAEIARLKRHADKERRYMQRYGKSRRYSAIGDGR